ncbi:hypothetical protein BHM03_00043921 [Ensete ventricosum]|nr:hypothetical protein BHM03_00043921 [Ensete ventricosum]
MNNLTQTISCQHLAASRGHEDITLFLIQEGVDVNLSGTFFELFKGARLNIGEPGSHLCTAVARGDSDFIRRVLKYGIDPNSKDYDQQLLNYRWGTTPLDEAVKSGSRSMMELLENAKSDELSMLRECAQEIKGFRDNSGTTASIGQYYHRIKLGNLSSSGITVGLGSTIVDRWRYHHWKCSKKHKLCFSAVCAVPSPGLISGH